MVESLRQYSAPRVNPKHTGPVRIVGQPRPCFIKMKLVKGGPYVGARITYGPPIDPETGQPQPERSFLWSGDIDGRPDPKSAPAPTDNVFRIWTSGVEIEEGEYRYLVETAAWARQYAPDSPEANPTKPIDLSQIDPRSLFAKRTAS